MAESVKKYSNPLLSLARLLLAARGSASNPVVGMSLNVQFPVRRSVTYATPEIKYVLLPYFI